MRKNKKVVWILFIVFISITFTLIIKNTYALLETIAVGDASMAPGKWSIKLNNVDISSGVVNNFVIDNIIYSENSNVASNRIAPGRSGYFDIELDPSGTEVAIRYDIFIDLESASYPSNIAFSIQDLTNGNAVLTDINTYTGVIDLEDIDSGDPITLRLNVIWSDIVSNNETDTELASTKGNSLQVPVTVVIQQYQGETIVPMS